MGQAITRSRERAERQEEATQRDTRRRRRKRNESGGKDRKGSLVVGARERKRSRKEDAARRVLRWSRAEERRRRGGRGHHSNSSGQVRVGSTVRPSFSFAPSGSLASADKRWCAETRRASGFVVYVFAAPTGRRAHPAVPLGGSDLPDHTVPPPPSHRISHLRLRGSPLETRPLLPASRALC